MWLVWRVQWAMYNLIFFYHTLVTELSGLKPFAKVICIKAVVFFTFWYATRGRAPAPSCDVITIKSVLHCMPAN